MFFGKRSRPEVTDSKVSAASDRTAGGPDGSPQPSVIGGSTRFRGQIHGRGPLIIRGQVEGTIGIEKSLRVAPSGRLDAEARVDEILVEGWAGGTIIVRGNLELRSTGTIEARIQVARLRVEDGGILKGVVTRLASSN